MADIEEDGENWHRISKRVAPHHRFYSCLHSRSACSILPDVKGVKRFDWSCWRWPVNATQMKPAPRSQ